MVRESFLLLKSELCTLRRVNRGDTCGRCVTINI